MYLTDADLLEFLVKTKDNLTESVEVNDDLSRKCGYLFVKENVNIKKFIIDREDNSIMRTVQHFEALF